MPVPFYVHSALSNSLEHVRGYGLGRDDGTVQVAHIADGHLYTAGVVSNLFRVRNVSDSTGPATLTVKLPPQIYALLCRSGPVRSHFLQTVDGLLSSESAQQELAIVDLANEAVQPVSYKLPEPSKENNDLNSPSTPLFSADWKVAILRRSLLSRACLPAQRR